MLEALTYRYRGHSVSDPATYRTKEELQSYQEKDPITTHAKLLKKLKLVNDATLDEWNKEIKAQVKEYEKWADESPEPEPELAYQHVYAE